jgi:hypothetical protein
MMATYLRRRRAAANCARDSATETPLPCRRSFSPNAIPILGDEKGVTVQFQVFGNLGSVTFQVGNGLDVGDGRHSDLGCMDGSKYSTEFSWSQAFARGEQLTKHTDSGQHRRIQLWRATRDQLKLFKFDYTSAL